MPFSESTRVSDGTLVLLEQLHLPPELDGGDGTNRALGARSQIAAQTDVDAVKAWLARFVATKATFDTYRKESERLLLWSTTELRKPLSSLTHEDLLLYKRFLADPQPAQRWVMAGRKLARADPSWRPFAGPLFPSSERQAFVILNTLFAWLVNAGYLAGNPLSLSRQRARKAKPRVTRFLEDDLWQAVKISIDTMPRDTAREQEHYARVRWLISLLYLLGLRISEVVSNPMGGFFRRRDRDGQDRWWLAITGKGDKERLLPATTELMAELKRRPTQGHHGSLLLLSNIWSKVKSIIASAVTGLSPGSGVTFVFIFVFLFVTLATLRPAAVGHGVRRCLALRQSRVKSLDASYSVAMVLRPCALTIAFEAHPFEVILLLALFGLMP
jgi:integrase